MFAYADDLKIIATSADQLAALFAVVQEYLGYLGLCVTHKYKVLVIGQKCTSVRLGSTVYTQVKELCFLGIKLTCIGHVEPWRTDVTTGIYGVRGRVVSAGLGDLPMALVKALQLKVIPAIVYGGEVWGIHWLAEVLRGKTSPYVSPHL